MRAFIITASVLAVVLAAADALFHCNECVGKNAKECKGKSVDCATGTITCSTNSELCESDGEMLPTFSRTCTPIVSTPFPTCNITIHVTGGENKEIDLYAQRDCCFVNNCNTNGYSIIKDIKPNGKECDACYEKQAEKECTSTKKIPCVGNQGQCVTFYGNIEKANGVVAPYSYKGCITTFGCLVGFAALEGTKPVGPYKLECSWA